MKKIKHYTTVQFSEDEADDIDISKEDIIATEVGSGDGRDWITIWYLEEGQ